MIKDIFLARSTNGRTGLSVVGPAGTVLPAEGGLRHVGRVAGVVVYEFLPGATGQWVAVDGDVTVHGGATLVVSVDLQSSQEASLLLLSAQAVVERHSYKRRSSRIVAFVAGVETPIPAGVLGAMGLVKPEGAVVEVVAPPALAGTMAAAFAALLA